MMTPDKKLLFTVPAVLAALAGEPLFAADSAPGTKQASGNTTVQSAEDILKQKLHLVNQLLNQSAAPAIQRITQSSNALAKGQIATARSNYLKAQAEFNAGRLDQAGKLLNEALQLVGSASRLVPDPALAGAEARAHYQELLEGMRTFQNSYQIISDRLSAKKGPSSVVALDLEKIRTSVDKAEALARAGNFKEANVWLTSAHDIVVSTLNNMVKAETFVYDLKFNSPEEEFKYEVDRYRSYDDLLPIAKAELKPPGETVKLTDRVVQQSRELLAFAEKNAAKGDYAAAVKSMQGATEHLQRSLRILGVDVPQSSQFKQ